MTVCRAAVLQACSHSSSSSRLRTLPSVFTVKAQVASILQQAPSDSSCRSQCSPSTLSSSRLVNRTNRKYVHSPNSSGASRRAFSSSSRRTLASAISAAELQFGQPLHETHSHMLDAGELTPGITALEYARRRAALAEALPPGAVAVLAAATVKYRSGAVFYQFQQDANFFYLTGFEEPEAVAVICRPSNSTTAGDGASDHMFYLFVRPKDPFTERWEGSRSGEQAALDVFNADESGDINALTSHLPALLDGAREIYTDIPTEHTVASAGGSHGSSFFTRFFGRGGSGSSSGEDSFAALVANKDVKPLKEIMNKLRGVKSPAEVAVMRAVGRASGRALTAAMKRSWSTEKELAAFLSWEFSRRGCDNEQAYIPVVAGGANGLGIHYTANNALLGQDKLVLVDAGGQIGHYVTDITRTWPVGRRAFSDAQRDLYEAVLSVQRSCVSLCRGSANNSLDAIHDAAASGLRAALKDLGFDFGGLRGKNRFNDLFPHHVGHYVGLDVHDTPGLPRTARLQPGNVVTIEPGVYVPHDERWPKHFHGMAIRIEDSVAVEQEAPLVLTTEAVKEVADIEAILGKSGDRQED